MFRLLRVFSLNLHSSLLSIVKVSVALVPNHWPCFTLPVISLLTLYMARPLAMAILLLFVHPLLDLVLLHLHPAHRTDLPSYLPQTAARDCSSWGGEGRVPLLVSLVTNEPIRCDSPITGNPPNPPPAKTAASSCPLTSVCHTQWGGVAPGPCFRGITSHIH